MNIEQAKKLFPEEIAELLSFEEKPDYIKIIPRQFLGTENFAKIAEVVKQNGGDYVSAGKDSHFRVSRDAAPAVEPSPKPPTNLHFKVSKLTVTLGRTVDGKTGDEWRKQSYGLEVEVDSDQLDIVEKAKLEAASLVNSWLTATLGHVSSEFIPHIDIGELNEGPWKTFQKEPAKPGQAAWIKNPVEFSSWTDPPNALLQLVKALKRTPDEKLDLGDMTYTFSGDKKQFTTF